jgi:hypothetical protein
MAKRPFPRRVRIGEILKVFRDPEWRDRGLLDDMDRCPTLLAIYLHAVRSDPRCNFNRHVTMVHREFFDCMIDEEVQLVVGNVLRTPEPYKFKPDTVARRFEITNADRVRLKLKTIGATDFPEAARLQRRKDEARKRNERNRRDRGGLPREVRQAEAIGAGSPWITAGMPRSTWYRHEAARRRGVASLTRSEYWAKGRARRVEAAALGTTPEALRKRGRGHLSQA